MNASRFSRKVSALKRRRTIENSRTSHPAQNSRISGTSSPRRPGTIIQIDIEGPREDVESFEDDLAYWSVTRGYVALDRQHLDVYDWDDVAGMRLSMTFRPTA